MVSAWDVAGAVVWTFFALLFLKDMLFDKTLTSSQRGLGWVMLGVSSAFSIYCIARLYGAHT